MSIPWTNLITAGSTLVAAVGGASLTALLGGRADERRLAHERWVEIVGSEEAADKAQQVAEAGSYVGLRLSDSYLARQLTELEAGKVEHRELRQRASEFATLCRRELSE
ncbi:hypothetical protein [Actinomadura napierensis]|uniref:SLATT domain-containing protein n=1 Tax=Actinomadura napierensis TaxID=267854 RepID=A0ABN2ZZE2_9ACTN